MSLVSDLLLWTENTKVAKSLNLVSVSNSNCYTPCWVPLTSMCVVVSYVQGGGSNTRLGGGGGKEN